MFEHELAELADQHLLRRLRLVESATGPLVTIAGRQAILMASNDYLGLAAHRRLKQAATEAIARYGVGAGASRLVSGTLPPHRDLEAALARFKGTEAALTFGSGYLVNLGLIPALAGPGDLILADRLCHASLLDGCRLSGAEFRVYRHGDLAHLDQLLSRRPARRAVLIVTDGVFSMDGDLAPLPGLLDLAERYEARLLVDDAHGTGVMGKEGRGTAEHFGVEARLPVQMGTLGKALGAAGAYVAGPGSLIEYLVNRARSFIYTTAPPPAIAAAAVAALEVVEREPARRARLWANRARLHGGLAALGFTLGPSESPIIPVLVGEAEPALALAERLWEHGVLAPAIRPPTVPKGTSRIRLTITSEHSPEQIARVLDAFAAAGREMGLIPG